MSSDAEGWSDLPKSVKILDISILGYGILFTVGFLLYFLVLDHTVQNLMPIFLTAILLLFTWNFRSKLNSSSEYQTGKRYFREWLIIGILSILIITMLIFFYPVTY